MELRSVRLGPQRRGDARPPGQHVERGRGRQWPGDLYLDATFLDARWARKVENVSALVAYAVGPEGHRRLLAVTLGAEESQQSWSELLEQLQDRGLGGVELVIADEHAGLAAAVRRFLPEARRQRCTVHLQRNVGARGPPPPTQARGA